MGMLAEPCVRANARCCDDVSVELKPYEQLMQGLNFVAFREVEPPSGHPVCRLLKSPAHLGLCLWSSTTMRAAN